MNTEEQRLQKAMEAQAYIRFVMMTFNGVPPHEPFLIAIRSWMNRIVDRYGYRSLQ